MSEMDDKLTLSDISEKLIEEGIPPELLDNIYIHLDYSTLSELYLNNEQWHSAYKRFIILPYDETEDYHRLFLWWTNKTRKPFEIKSLHKDEHNFYSCYLKDHEGMIRVYDHTLYFIKLVYTTPLKESQKIVIEPLTITDDFPFQVYKHVTNINKGTVKYDYELTDENRKELKIETKTTHYIVIQHNEQCKVEIYISYFYVNNMRIKVIRTLLYDFNIHENRRMIGEIFPYQLGDNYILPSNIDKYSMASFYVPSMTTMDYESDNQIFIQLRKILHKEITDRTLMFGNFSGYF